MYFKDWSNQKVQQLELILEKNSDDFCWKKLPTNHFNWGFPVILVMPEQDFSKIF